VAEAYATHRQCGLEGSNWRYDGREGVEVRYQVLTVTSMKMAVFWDVVSAISSSKIYYSKLKVKSFHCHSIQFIPYA
jgi:hypothetical protein